MRNPVPAGPVPSRSSGGGCRSMDAGSVEGPSLSTTATFGFLASGSKRFSRNATHRDVRGGGSDPCHDEFHRTRDRDRHFGPCRATSMVLERSSFRRLRLGCPMGFIDGPMSAPESPRMRAGRTHGPERFPIRLHRFEIRSRSPVEQAHFDRIASTRSEHALGYRPRDDARAARTARG